MWVTEPELRRLRAKAEPLEVRVSDLKKERGRPTKYHAFVRVNGQDLDLHFASGRVYALVAGRKVPLRAVNPMRVTDLFSHAEYLRYCDTWEDTATVVLIGKLTRRPYIRLVYRKLPERASWVLRDVFFVPE